jgi:3-oxoacyl-[acyl-carrier protein] reductase
MLQGKVIIVTGASRGLGQRMVRRLAERGATVVAAARSLTPGHHNPNGAALALAVDVREETQVQEMVQQTLNCYGKIDVLVNNAGLMVGDVAFTDITPGLWRKILATNLAGAFLCCWAVVPFMLRQGSGTIVNITSGAAVRTGFLNIPYGVSKAGLDRLTLGLDAELKNRGIACISLSPSVSATETVRRMFPDQNVDSWAQSPELPAQALCALLEDDPLLYTGQVLSVREFLHSKGLLVQD